MYQDSVSAEPGSEPAEAVDTSAAADAVPAELQTPDGAEIADATSAHLFRDELARAMHAAAERERIRIEAAADEDAIAHVDKVRSRALAEAAELKRLAEEDVTGIRSWAKTEIERIRTDADLQVNERRERLEQHLIAHATIIDGEVDRVSEAVDGYRNELDVYFVRLAIERDPSEIARLADTVPEPPDLEVIRAVARAEAVERLSRLEAAGDGGPAAEAVEASAADVEAETPAAEAELVAVPMASAESAGDAVESESDLVAVMDPALAATDEAAPAATDEAAPAATAEAEPASGTGSSDDDAGPDAGASGSGESSGSEASAAPASDMAATAGEPAADEEAAAPEPVGVAAGPTAESNPATRFIRSLTGWGSHDHGNGGQVK